MSRSNCWVFCALGILVWAGVPGRASTLYDASPYNVFVFGSYTETGADTGGRIAAGGNVSFSGTYSINQANLDSLTAPNNDNLVVGAQITSGTANLFGGGNAYVANESGAGTIQFNGGGSESTGTAPFSFSIDKTELTNYSAYLATQPNTATATSSFGTLTLTGTNANLNVFTIDGSLLSSNSTITITVPAGATVLINVTGTTVSTTTGGMTVNGGAVSGNSTTPEVDKVIWNFYQASTVNLNGGFLGTVLAPGAAVNGNNYQQLDGQLIAQSFSGTTEFHDFLFTGSLPPPTSTPEPAGVAMLGLGLVGIACKRLIRR